MRRDDVKFDDVIEVVSSGLRVQCRVSTVDFYGEDGWQIEMMDVNAPYTYRSWKQRHDGGRITKINGKEVPDVDCNLCLNNNRFRDSQECRSCSVYSNFKKPRVSSGMCPVHNRRCIYWYQNCEADNDALRDCKLG